jgi:hypothetical protein
MPASAHRNLQPCGAREVERCRDIAGAEAANDDRGPAIDQRIEAATQPVIPGIGWGDDRTRHGPLEFGQHLFVHWSPFLVFPIISETRAGLRFVTAVQSETHRRGTRIVMPGTPLSFVLELSVEPVAANLGLPGRSQPAVSLRDG